MFLRLKTQVAMRYLILILSCVVISSIAFSNENYSAEYQGVKILTNDGYEPNDTSVILEIIDTCAYLHYSERTDTFLFRTNLNNWKIYRGPSRASNANKRMKISKDSIILQVDNHQGNTLFQNLLPNCKVLNINTPKKQRVPKETNWKQKFQKPQNENICLTYLNTEMNGNFHFLSFCAAFLKVQNQVL